MKYSKSNDYLDNLLLGLNERFDVRPAGPVPDIERLRSIIKDAVSTKNPFHLDAENPNRKSTPPPFTYYQSTKPGKNFSRKFDYRKGEKPVYGRNGAEMDEGEILERLNELLAENEVSGLGSAELAEVKELQKKVK